LLQMVSHSELRQGTHFSSELNPSLDPNPVAAELLPGGGWGEQGWIPLSPGP